MLKVSAREYINLGVQMESARVVFFFTENESESSEDRSLSDSERDDLRNALQKMLAECKKLNLPVSTDLLSLRVSDLPETRGAFEVLIDAVRSEIKNKLFLFVPPEHAKYYDLSLPNIVTTGFPEASRELVSAGNSIAASLWTASVFHSMRAAEIGVRALADALNVAFGYPIELAEMGKIIGELEPKVQEFKAGARSTEKDENLRFYSEALAEFRHFNNGWRIRVAHARVRYEETDAIKAFEHTLSLFEVISSRLQEKGAWLD
jgi:hypothetical protein